MRKLIKINNCFGCVYQATGNKLAIASDGKAMSVNEHYCLKEGPAKIIDVDIIFDLFPEWCPLDSDLT